MSDLEFQDNLNYLSSDLSESHSSYEIPVQQNSLFYGDVLELLNPDLDIDLSDEQREANRIFFNEILTYENNRNATVFLSFFDLGNLQKELTNSIQTIVDRIFVISDMTSVVQSEVMLKMILKEYLLYLIVKGNAVLLASMGRRQQDERFKIFYDECYESNKNKQFKEFLPIFWRRFLLKNEKFKEFQSVEDVQFIALPVFFAEILDPIYNKEKNYVESRDDKQSKPLLTRMFGWLNIFKRS
ncbi:hypothetical protein NUSPORA_01613 [Nucleospora cyclopteri]